MTRGLQLALMLASACSPAGGKHISRVGLAHPRADVERLRRGGLDVVAVSGDQRYADVSTRDEDQRARLSATGLSELKGEVFGGEPLAPDQRYKTPEQIETLLKAYVDRYPHLVTLKSIGKSLQGRDIWAIKLTSDASFYAEILTKPVVLFNAMHHAREVMSTEIAVDTIDWLLAGYGSDPNATSWLDDNEIWVIPMLNVDGNHQVWTNDSMWRKNARGGYGVDINRNYPYAWNTCNGSSSDRSADDYHGESAASEPETQVMMAFVKEIRPVFDISYHSYSEIVIYPYGCDGVRTPGDDVVEETGKAMAEKIVTDDGQGHYKPGTSWELLYAVDGSDIDWMYHELHVIPFVIEVNSGFGSGGFQPPWSMRDDTVKRLRPAWQHILTRVSGSGIRGRISDSAGAPLAGAAISVTSADSPEMGASTYTAGPDGVYHVVLRAGTYAVRFSSGGKNAERRVTVGEALKSLSVRL